MSNKFAATQGRLERSYSPAGLNPLSGSLRGTAPDHVSYSLLPRPDDLIRACSCDRRVLAANRRQRHRAGEWSWATSLESLELLGRRRVSLVPTRYQWNDIRGRDEENDELRPHRKGRGRSLRTEGKSYVVIPLVPAVRAHSAIAIFVDRPGGRGPAGPTPCCRNRLFVLIFGLAVAYRNRKDATTREGSLLRIRTGRSHRARGIGYPVRIHYWLVSSHYSSPEF